MDNSTILPGGIPPQTHSHPARKWFLIVIFGLIVVIGAFIVASYYFHIGKTGVSVVRMEGTIDTSDVSDGTTAGSEAVGNELRNAADDPMVEAIVLRVDSPGGTPAGAEEIIRDLDYAKTKKPVVVSMGDIATSAAYYVSSHADKIYADPDTFTAAVGVLWKFSDISGYNIDQGYNFTVIKSGAKKDMGNSDRPLTQDEQVYAQSIVNESFEAFISDVTSQRVIARSDIEDGRVIRGADAVKLNIVDELGNLNDAIDGAKALAHDRG